MGIRQSIVQSVAKALGYPFGNPNAPRGVGIQFFDGNTPPGWNYQSYLKAYGEIGILYACVNVIAQAVSKVPWHLYELNQDGERTEITKHEMVDLLNRMNPFQSRYQFMYLGTMYKLLVGEEFWQMNFNGKGIPAEIWLAPPAFMTVVPHPTKYIDHYEYRRENTKVIFDVDEIIHVKTPNPFNEYRGLSPAQALTIDLDTERFANRYQQKLFFNEARPDFFITYPAENMPPAESRKELYEEWDERYRGFRNRGRPAFLWGGDVKTLTMSNRDMDFEKLRLFNRNDIMAAYHIPPAILGITEHVNRSNADTSLYDFAMYCIQPELAELRESMNKELVPFFGENLYLDFENPVPEDTTASVNNTVNLFKAGIITRNDALQMIDMEPLTGPEGDEYASQPAAFGGQLGQPPEPSANTPDKGYRVLGVSNPKVSVAQKDSYWKEYVSRAESYERRIIYELQLIGMGQKTQALDDLRAGDKPKIDKKAFIGLYKEKMTPILIQVMTGAMKAGHDLLEPENPHKQAPIALTQAAILWLTRRIGWAADEIGTESADRLAALLADAYAEGVGTDEIARRIEGEFDYFSDIRAQRIARTETMTASAEGAIEGYEAAGISQAEWYTAEDERVCDVCGPMHGDIEDVSVIEGMIPAHPDCRCVWVPVVE